MLITAEQLAGLPHIEQGGFHAYRRLYAVERKHLPDVDLARSAGWRDLAAMKRSYQQPDPVTTLRVIENEPESGSSARFGHTPTGKRRTVKRLDVRLPFGMRIITRDELKAKMDRGDPFTLFEVLPHMYWRKHHLPSAKSLPPTEVAARVTELVPDRNAEIVLYCWDHDCPTSGWAGTELEELGYTNILEYSAGKKDWIDAGLPMTKD